jgi:hypothetical protein
MPATTDYLPTREADLQQWSETFDALITATPAAYGLTAAQAVAYAALHTGFSDAWRIANANATRTPSAIETKNTAKEALIRGPGGIRELAGIIQEFPGTTNTERTDLGLTVRDPDPSPIPAPTMAPGLDIVSVTGRTVRIRLHDAASPSSRAKPDGVKGASVYSFVGAAAPETIEGWKYEGSTTRTVVDVDFPATVSAGSKVWLAAYWTNPRLQSGPPCDPVATTVGGGLAAAS